MFQIRYALGGGFGGCNNKEWEDCEYAESLDHAEQIAYELSCEEYDQYDGLHGLRSVDQIIEEDDVDEQEALAIWSDERENWLDYEAREV